MTLSLARPRASFWMFLAAGAYLGYFALLVYCDLTRPAYPGLEIEFGGGGMLVTGVLHGSAADAAGLVPGDLVLARDGDPVASKSDWNRLDMNLEPGRPIDLEIDRAGERRHAVLRLSGGDSEGWTPARLALLAMRAVQLVTLALGL